MKKRTVTFLAMMLSILMLFSVSGCDKIASLLPNNNNSSQVGTVAENQAFAQVKSDFSSTMSNYKGSLTITSTAENKMETLDSDGNVVETEVSKGTFLSSFDYTNKIGFGINTFDGKHEITEKLFKEDSKYYFYDTTDFNNYEEISSKKINETFTLPSFEIIELDTLFSLSGDFTLADNFDQLKKAYIDVYQESVERQKEALKKINDSIESEQKRLDVNSNKYKELEGLKRNLDGVKAKATLTSFEKDSEYTLKIATNLSSDTIMYNSFNRYNSLGEFNFEIEIKTKSEKIIEIILNLEVIRTFEEGKQIMSSSGDMLFDYSFDQTTYDSIKAQPPADFEPTSDADKEIAFHVSVGDKEYTQTTDLNKYELTQSALSALNDLQFRYFGQSVTMGRRVYLDAQRTQEFDLLNTTVNDLCQIEDIYIDVTINDGYALYYNNDITKKGFNEIDEQHKKYRIVNVFKSDVQNYPNTGFYYKNLAQESSLDLSEYTTEIVVNGQKLSNKILNLENKGFYEIDYISLGFAEQPNVFDCFYALGIY